MDVQRNHLIDGKTFAEFMKSNPNEAKRYTPVPDYLQEVAKKTLSGQESVHVNPKSKSPLAKWAKELRKNLNIQENE